MNILIKQLKNYETMHLTLVNIPAFMRILGGRIMLCGLLRSSACEYFDTLQKASFTNCIIPNASVSESKVTGLVRLTFSLILFEKFKLSKLNFPKTDNDKHGLRS